MKNRVNNSLFNKQLVNASFVESFRKLDPRAMIKNPIMFTVEAVTFAMLLLIVRIAVTGDTSQGSLLYNLVIFAVLLLTVLFANFAEAIAEARGRAQANSLRKTREETPAKRIEPDGQSHIVSSSELKQGDLFECVAGDTVAADGEIVELVSDMGRERVRVETTPYLHPACIFTSAAPGGRSFGVDAGGAQGLGVGPLDHTPLRWDPLTGAALTQENAVRVEKIAAREDNSK